MITIDLVTTGPAGGIRALGKNEKNRQKRAATVV